MALPKNVIGVAAPFLAVAATLNLLGRAVAQAPKDNPSKGSVTIIEYGLPEQPNEKAVKGALNLLDEAKKSNLDPVIFVRDQLKIAIKENILTFQASKFSDDVDKVIQIDDAENKLGKYVLAYALAKSGQSRESLGFIETKINDPSSHAERNAKILLEHENFETFKKLTLNCLKPANLLNNKNGANYVFEDAVCSILSGQKPKIERSSLKVVMNNAANYKFLTQAPFAIAKPQDLILEMRSLGQAVVAEMTAKPTIIKPVIP